jgi:PBP1b-binding outer membrane lipoprotein LpoB
MKKIFSMLALVSLLTVGCKDKKEDKKEEPTTTPATTEPTTTPTTTDPAPTSNNADSVPSFSDPEVQKFANDYAAFVKEYKEGMKDPAKLTALAQKLQDWSKRATEIGTKLATSPDEAKKWTDWTMALAKEMMPK